MRNLLLFGPLLWLRNLVFWILVLVLILMLLLYLAGNSSVVVKKAIDTFAPDYNISYEYIRGNAFNGFEIINPQYNHKAIAKKVTFKWNPNLLAEKKIEVSKLHIKDADVDVIGALIDSFRFDSNKTSKDNNKSNFDFVVDINDIDISLAPFVKNDRSVTHTRLLSNHIRYINHQVKVESAELNVSMDSDIYDNILIDTMNVKMVHARYDVSSRILESTAAEIHATSNITSLDYQGNIKKNHLLGKVILIPKPALYEIYKIPLRKDAIREILVDLDASTEIVIANIDTKAKQLLDTKKDTFNLDVNLFHSYVNYEISRKKVNVVSNAIVDTPYAKKIEIKNNFTYDNGLSHYGEIIVPNIESLNAKYAKFLSTLQVQYRGNSKSVNVDLYNDALKGTFVTKDFKTAQAHIETKKSIVLDNIITLSQEFKDANADIWIDAPLNLQDLSNINATIQAKSNMINIDAKVHYTKAITVDGNVTIPKDSLIRSYSSEVEWESLTPLKTFVRYENERLDINLKAKALNTNIVYNIPSGKVDGKVKLAGIIVDIQGNTKDKLNIKTDISSLDTLGKEINTLYKIGDLPPIKGNISAILVVDKLQSATLNLTAPKLIYQVDKHTSHTIEDITMSASMDAEKIIVKSYQATYDNQKYYSNKIAKITLGNKIIVSNFWLNDELLFEGSYDSQTQQGNFQAKAERFHIKNKIVDIYTKLNSTITLDGEATMVTGKITLLEGLITPQASGRSFANASDIIILQQQRKKKKSSFMDNLNLTLQVDTKKPLLLKQKNIHIRLKPELTITKQENLDMMFFGDITLLKGSTYKLEDKNLILEKSHIYLTGKVDKPTLDIKAKYKSLNHLITIGVTGTPTKPRLDFSSSPALTKEQILSVLLFDTEAGGDTHSGNAMMKMMGGAMAKAALSEVGVKVDHLVFGEGNSLEVGKKLTKRITVIYINDEVPKVELKYKHGKNTESVIGASEESQSYDIIFKKDF